MSVVYRDRERYDDTRSVASGRTSGGTKVTRYIVKEDDFDSRSRYEEPRRQHDDGRSYVSSRYGDRRTDYDRGDSRIEETKIITTRDDESPRLAPSQAYSSRDPGYSRSRETITIRRDESPHRRSEYWREAPADTVDDRELAIRRTVERDDGHRERGLAVSRVDERRDSKYSDYEIVNPQRSSFDERDRDVQRYIRQTDYYQPPPAPQPPQTIIIRQEPIIIRERERPREEDYQIVKKSDVEEERSVARKSEPRDEEYFFEKKVKERYPEEDRGERRLTRREISPGDSISQVGRRGRDHGYESDDSMVYVRKEKVTDEYDSDDSAHRKRDWAAGALAGVGAAELIRRHNDKEGKGVSHGGGRVIRDVGAGLVGAVAAEGIRRYRSRSRRRGSRSRSDSRGRYSRRRDSRRRSRSRSGSNSNLKNFGGLGLAAAAVAAGALIASRNKKDASPERRSRSRTRRSSRSRSRAASTRASLENDPNATDDRNPLTRNKKAAAAGALGAAAMALYERHRSKSRGRDRSGSPNRLKQGVPVIGAGLAAAGLAHMYEKRKAKDQADDLVKNERRRERSRSERSRSRGQPDSTYHDDHARGSFNDTNLVSYGSEPLHGNNYGDSYYGRPGMEQDYYNNNTRDMVPAPVPPAATSSFDATSRRPRSASRTRSLSPGSDGRHRSRSRGAAAAAAAVGAGVAASEFENRRKEKKERKRRSRDRQRSREDSYPPYTSGQDAYEEANWHTSPSAAYPPGMNDPYASQTGFYPQTSQFPPPPGSMPQQQGYGPQAAPPPAQPAYAPQDFPPPPSGAPQAQQFNYDPYAPRARGTDENVSAASFSVTPDQHDLASNGVSATRQMAMSPPIVGPNVTVQPPSTDTPAIHQASNRFPGQATNPFQKLTSTDHAVTGTGSGDASPGHHSDSTSPVRSSSRTAQRYTPHAPVRPERDRSSSASAPLRDGPVVTDAPSPLPQPKPIPEDPRVTAFRNAAYAAPMPLLNHDSRSPRQPEMQQKNRGSIPFMPSPDIRPPSDPNLVAPQQQMTYFDANESAPSLPNLIIPDLPKASSPFVPPADERPARDRSRSQSQPRTADPVDGDATPRASTPTQDQPKKSVSFAAKPEFSDAPTPRSRSRAASDSEADDIASTRRKNYERERERERDRDRGRDHRSHDHSRERRGYDAGDDLSDDTPFEDHRRRSYDRERDRDRDRGNRHGSRRERSNTQSLDRDSASTRDRERDRDKVRDPRRANTMEGGRSRSRKHRHREGSQDSDSTVDLPDRFDERGRRKPDSYGDGGRSPEEDILAEKLDQILGGLFGGGSKRH